MQQVTSLFDQVQATTEDVVQEQQSQVVEVEATTETTKTKHAGRGRPLSEKGKRVKAAVVHYIEKHGEEGFTVRDIISATKQAKVTINNHVNLMVQRGELIRAERRNGSGRGRPMTVFKVTTSDNTSGQPEQVIE